jgi:hypothetical protein
VDEGVDDHLWKSTLFIPLPGFSVSASVA